MSISTDALTEQLAQIQRQLVTLRAEYSRIGGCILDAQATEGALKDEIARRRLADAQALGQGLDWPYLLQEGLGTEHYKACNKALNSLGLQGSGYFHETNQRAIKIAVKRRSEESVAAIATSLEIVMPHLVPLKDGWCYISILEYTLSARTSYKLRFRPGREEYQCVYYSYDGMHVDYSSNSLRDMLTFISIKHYDE